ncbi:MAG: arsenate reductase (glutaredoxin) [Alphaproteobacteria bacterium]|nr:arsenate reductase (glutaredoxin) [Alphaproteobacteria bacterium]
MKVTIWHNPRCSKSRATLALLRERGIEPHIVEYLKDPPTAVEIRAALLAMGKDARALLRRGEAEYRALGLDDPALGEAEIVAAMARHPVLIERPVVLAGKRAALGRPPDSVLDIL